MLPQSLAGIFFHNHKKETNAMDNAMEIVKAQTIISINGHEYKAEIVQGTDDNRYYFEMEETSHGENK
jgi:hypothetical protein